MLVLDASVAVKWLVPEENRTEARALLDPDLVLAAPSLIVSEVATGVSRKARLKQISHADATRALAFWLATFSTGDALVLYADRDLLADALSLSLELDHQLPDCIYLALARRLDAPLVTADEKLIRKVGRRDDLRLIRLGEDFSAGSGGRR